MAHFIIRKPIITEKTLAQVQKNNIYTFEVNPKAHKNQIKVEIERLFDVKVDTVRTVMQAKEVKRTGPKRQPTPITSNKKAFVQLKKGFTIELFEVMRES